MRARDVSQGEFSYVTADTELSEVVRLMRAFGAVSVVDRGLTPIGIVTRRNIVGAVNGDELGAPPAFLMRGRRALPAPRRLEGLTAGDVMSAPALTGAADASAKELLSLMEAHEIKHLPLVEGGRLAGLVTRAQILGALGGVTAAARATGPSAADFRALVEAHQAAEARERVERRQALEAQRKQQIKELAARRLTDARWRALLDEARRAAGAGAREHMLVRFPSQLCADNGRMINAPDRHWPETLRGEPADIFRRWETELQPKGFRIAAQIVEFPDGVPGDVALFLMWGG